MIRSHPETLLSKRDGLWRAETKPDEEALSSAIGTTNTAKSQAVRRRRSPRRVLGWLLDSIKKITDTLITALKIIPR